MRRLLKLLLPVVLVAIPAHAGVGAPTANDSCYTAVTTGTTASCTIVNQPAAGDIIIANALTNVALTLASVKDNAGAQNTFSIPGGMDASGCEITNDATSGSACITYLIEPSGTGGKTFTLTISGGTCSACSIYVTRYPVTGGTVAFGSASGTSGTGTTITAPTITVSAAATLIVGFATAQNQVSAVSGAWTATPNGVPAGGFGEEAEYQLSVSSNTAVGFTITSGTWDSLGAAFQFTVTGSQSFKQYKLVDYANQTSGAFQFTDLLTTAGDVIVIACTYKPAYGACTTVPTDTEGNTYTLVSTKIHASNEAGQKVYQALNIVGGTNDTVTCHSDLVTSVACLGVEIAGVSALDQGSDSTQATGTSTSPLSPSITTTKANEILLGFGAVNPACSCAYTGTPSTGFTMIAAGSQMAEYQIVTSTGSYTAGGTVTPSIEWVMGIVSYSAGGSSVSVGLGGKAKLGGKGTLK